MLSPGLLQFSPGSPQWSLASSAQLHLQGIASQSQNPPVAPTSLRIKPLLSTGSANPVIPLPQLLSISSAHHCHLRAFVPPPPPPAPSTLYSWAAVALSFHSDVPLQVSPLQSDLQRPRASARPLKQLPPLCFLPLSASEVTLCPGLPLCCSVKTDQKQLEEE